MKNIQSVARPEYSEHDQLENNIYKISLGSLSFMEDMAVYTITLSFELEPELGELDDTQYPEEDILDKFKVIVRDKIQVPTDENPIMIHEYSSNDLNDIQNLASIIGKRVYNSDDGDTIALVIE